MENEKWLTPEKTAARVGRRVDQLARDVKAGKLPTPSYQFGPRSPRWDVDEIDAMMAKGKNADRPRQHPSGLANALMAKFEKARREKEARRRVR